MHVGTRWKLQAPPNPRDASTLSDWHFTTPAEQPAAIHGLLLNLASDDDTNEIRSHGARAASFCPRRIDAARWAAGRRRSVEASPSRPSGAWQPEARAPKGASSDAASGNPHPLAKQARHERRVRRGVAARTRRREAARTLERRSHAPPRPVHRTARRVQPGVPAAARGPRLLAEREVRGEGLCERHRRAVELHRVHAVVPAGVELHGRRRRRHAPVVVGQ